MKFGEYLHRGFVAQAICKNYNCLPDRVDSSEAAPRQITGVITRAPINGGEVKIPVPVVIHAYATTGVQPSAQVVALSTAYLLLTDQGLLPARPTPQDNIIEPITQNQAGHKLSIQDTPIITEINSQVSRQKLQQSRNIHGVTRELLSLHAPRDFSGTVKKHFQRLFRVDYDDYTFHMEPAVHCIYNMPFFMQNVLSKVLGPWYSLEMVELPIVYKKLRAMLAFSSTCENYVYGDWPKNLKCAGKMPLSVCLQQLGIPNTPQPSQLLSQYRVRQLISMLKLMCDMPIKLY